MMKFRQFITKFAVAIFLIGCIIYIPTRIFLQEFIKDWYSFQTEQGELMSITLDYKADRQVVSISGVAGLDTYIAFDKETFKSAEQIAEEFLKFTGDENGIHQYQILDKKLSFYTNESPYILTEDGKWYQIRYIHDWDLKDDIDLGWFVYLVEYRHENGIADAPLDNKKIGALRGEPMCSEADLLNSIGSSIHNLSDLKKRLFKSELIEWEETFFY